MQALMHVLITCKYQKDPIKNNQEVFCFDCGLTGFVQKHENEIPGLFQDNSRTFFSFQGLNFIDYQSIYDCFCRKTPNRKQVALHFYHRIIFIVVLINTGTTGKLNRSTVPPSLFNESSDFHTVFFRASHKSKGMEKNRCILLFSMTI